MKCNPSFFKVVLAAFFLFTGFIFSQTTQLDTSFGERGIVTTAVNTSGSGHSNAIAVQNDGKIISALSTQSGGKPIFSLARYKTDGSPDNTFGTGSVVNTQVGTAGNNANTVEVQNDGRIIAAGDCYNGNIHCFALVRYNPSGSRDSTFGTNGIVITSVGGSDDAVKSIAVQSDGKIVAVGYTFNTQLHIYCLAVVRYDSYGNLDSTFGAGGIDFSFLSAAGYYEYYANAVAIQKNGKIVVAGNSYSYSTIPPDINIYGDYIIERYNADGTLDNTFGKNGVVTTQISTDIGHSEDVPNSVLIQKDGKILAAGYSLNAGYYDFSMARYDSSGNLDNSFGTAGLVSTYLSGVSGAYSAAIQSDGKIVLAGYGGSLSHHNFALIRYNTDGSLDNSFGSNGILISSIGLSSDEAYTVAIQDSEKIIEAGLFNNGGFDETAIGRFNINGTIDNTFGTNGFVVSSAGNCTDIANSVEVQGDGKIIVGGSSDNGNNSEFTVLRYDSNGNADKYWGTNGAAITAVGTKSSQVNSVLEESDESIVAVGYGFTGKNDDFALVKYTPYGIPDNTFGAKGIVTTPIGMNDDIATSAAIQNDGKLLAAGYYLNGNYYNSVVVRYNTNGTLDNTFGSDGIAALQVGASHNFAQSVAVQSDGKIVIAGYSLSGSNYNFALVRYNTDGSLDDSFGKGGIVITPVETSGFAYSVLILNSKKIIASGYAWNGSNYGTAFARYNSDGTLDNTFGKNGLVFTQTENANLFAYSSAIQKDGKIIAAGYKEIGSDYQFVLIRYNPDGSLDKSFGTGGILNTRSGTSVDYGRAAAIQNDGKIIAAGYSSNYAGDNYKVFTLIRIADYTPTEIIKTDNADSPVTSSIEQNYPNPFNPLTTIRYSLSENSFVTIKVYDILGKEIKLLTNNIQAGGEHTIEFNAGSLASGVYFYSIDSKGLISGKEFFADRKMILLK